MKTRVVRSRCIGAGECVRVAPTVFQLDFDAKARVENPEGAAPETIREAAEACPTRAIFLTDEAGNQLFPPARGSA